MPYPVMGNYRAPHLASIAQQTMKEIHFASPEDMLVKGVTVASGYPRVMEGDFMARITSTGKFRRLCVCAVKAAQVTGDSTFICRDFLDRIIEPPFIVGEHINIASITDKTIVAVNYETGVVTISGTFGGAVSVNDKVVLTTADGTATAVGVAQHPLFEPSFDPAVPNSNILLTTDYQLDLILKGALVRTMLRGAQRKSTTDGTLDDTATTGVASAAQLDILDLAPAFDAVLIRKG